MASERRGLGRLPGGGTRWRVTLLVTAFSLVLLSLTSLAGYRVVEQQQWSSLQQDAIQELSFIKGLIEACSLPEPNEGPLPFEISSGTKIFASSPLLAPHEEGLGGPVLPLSAAELIPQSNDSALTSSSASITFGDYGYGNDLVGRTLDAIYADLPTPANCTRLEGAGDTVRVVVVLVDYQVRDVLTPVRGVFLWTVPIASLLVAIGAWLAVGRALRPVERIRSHLAGVHDAHNAARVPAPGTGDELDALASSVNAALDRLEANDARQREFIADAAHELRSPVASLRSTVEVARLYPDPAANAEALASVERQSLRLAGLVDSLLLLESLESAASDMTTVDLAELTRAQVADLAEELPPGIALDVTIEPGVQVKGHEHELARAVANLLANAQRYARTRIVVELHVTNGSAELTVGNDGPEIDPRDRERIFERLVRLDPSRASASGGSGLGLSIVARVVERAGGSVEATQRDHDTLFVVRLPLTDPS